jgi:ribosome-binding factor A
VSERIRRVNEAVKAVVAETLPDLKDPRLGFITVTEVRTTPDLRHAEVFYTALPDDPDALAGTADGLRSAAPLLRRELGRLRLKYVPALHFTHDPLPAQGRRMEQLLRGQRDEDETDDAP